VPPYLSSTDATGDWFGCQGVPGTSFDLASYVGLFVPAPLDALYGAASTEISVSVSTPGIADTIPWAVYSCATPTEPPIPVAFPVTAVSFIPGLAAEPLYPALAEQRAHNHRLHWSTWRRRHQHTAQRCHYQRRKSQPL
jgi:hypothetical protein